MSRPYVDEDGFFDFTGWTLAEVEAECPQYGTNGRSALIFDESSNRLVVRPECKERVAEALMNAAKLCAAQMSANDATSR